MTASTTSLTHLIGKKVVLKNNNVGEIVGVKEERGLITVQTGSKKTDRFPKNVTLLDDNLEPVISTHRISPQIQLEDTPSKANKKFSVNKRFGFMEKLSKMVLCGRAVSLIITGEGGLGKTYTVKKSIEELGYRDMEDYVFVKGYSTAKGLYRTLWEHNDKVIVFDDCDEVLKNDIAKNILKGALDSYDDRIISWVSQSTNSDLPEQFEFTGRIIFISNMKQEKVDQAVLSRSLTIDLSMSVDEKIERIRRIADKLVPELDTTGIDEVLELLEDNKQEMNDLNFRTFIKAAKIKLSEGEDWKELAEFMILS